MVADTAADGWRVGVDVGGTFTDVVAVRSAGDRPRQAKVGTDHGDPPASLVAALAAVGIDWLSASDLVHGTTVVTNAIVEGRLSEVVLVATAGFADTIAIGRQNRRHLYRLDRPPKLEPAVPEPLRLEVAERVDAHGDVLIDMSEEAIERVALEVRASGAEAAAVVLLHAYANGGHEARLAERLQREVRHVALSHRVSGEAREFERMSTTVLSAGLMPLVATYLDRLEAERPEASRLRLFHSAGGMAAPASLRDRPLSLALSGPAAGVGAAGWVAESLGLANAISFDMGGTTTDVCLIVEGRAEIRGEQRLAGRPLRLPMVAVESIGAGGGSIARLDAGALRVGPHSAGANPGPACYGLGGESPTVSDANLVLGYLSAERPLGGLRLDRQAAERALRPLARGIGVPGRALARGIVQIANAAMARALRRVTVERGIDGRECALLAFGGAGPMHAVELARSFGIERVVVPACSGAFSALGCATAALSYTEQRTVRMRCVRWDPSRLQAVREELLAGLAAHFVDADEGPPRVLEVAAVRYGGQSYAVEVPAPALDEPERLGEQFRAWHEALYGYATREPWELTALRMTLLAPRSIALAALGDGPRGQGGGPIEVSPCWFDAKGPVSTPRYERAGLSDGDELAGPAIVEDECSTVVLPPGATLTADAWGHLHIAVGEAP